VKPDKNPFEIIPRRIQTLEILSRLLTYNGLLLKFLRKLDKPMQELCAIEIAQNPAAQKYVW
jgi:hypothetical protein